MQCPLCQADNPPSADHCTKCSTPLPLATPPSDVTISPTMGGGTVVGRTEAWSVAVTPRPSSEAASKGQLEPGTILGAYASMIGVALLPYLLAASFMSAPGGILMAKIIMPDVKEAPFDQLPLGRVALETGK